MNTSEAMPAMALLPLQPLWWPYGPADQWVRLPERDLFPISVL